MGNLKEFIKRVFPPIRILGDANRRFRRWLRQRRLSARSRQDIFEDYFESNQWADKDSRSGEGSNMDGTKVVRELLPRLIIELNISSILDVPCGDFFWMSQIDLGNVSYIGGDIVTSLVESNQATHGSLRRKFMVIDACETILPDADMIFCRDALVHLSNDDALTAIRNFQRTNAQYLLTTTFTDMEDNMDVATGMWRPLNLCRAPFNFPQPIATYNEEYTAQQGRYHDKCLGIWRITDLQNIRFG